MSTRIEPCDKPIIIDIDGKSYVAPKQWMTGREIKELGNKFEEWLMQVDIVLDNGEKLCDSTIRDDSVMALESGMHFRILNPAKFGSTEMDLPPLLQTHIQILRDKGFTIEVDDSGSVTNLIFKDYPIPGDIWDRTKSDLLIATDFTYPNCKLDLFYIYPAIALKRGIKPFAVTERIMYDKRWQSFSWHLKDWNPARDNIIRYLGIVNERLNTNE